MSLVFALSLLVGLSLGLLGGGGAVLLVPLLTYVAQLTPKTAITSSLFAIAVTSTVALLTHWRSRMVCVRTGLAFGVAGMVGAYVGGRLAQWVPDRLLMLAFGGIMLLAGLAMLRARPVDERASLRPSAPGPSGLARMALRGGAVGLVTGMLGAGGGFLVVPTLVLLGRMPMRRAVATSLLVIALQSAAGFLGHLSHASVPWALVLPSTAIAALGGAVGGLLARHAPQRLLRRGFAGLVLMVAVFLLAHQLAGSAHASPGSLRAARPEAGAPHFALDAGAGMPG